MYKEKTYLISNFGSQYSTNAEDSIDITIKNKITRNILFSIIIMDVIDLLVHN